MQENTITLTTLTDCVAKPLTTVGKINFNNNNVRNGEYTTVKLSSFNQYVYLVYDGDFGVVGAFNYKENAERWINISFFRYTPRIEKVQVYENVLPEPYSYKK